MLEMENILAEKCESFAILSFDFELAYEARRLIAFIGKRKFWSTIILM